MISFWSLSLCLRLAQIGSILAPSDGLDTTDENAQYVVEGIGYDFIPKVLSRADIDHWIKTSDEDAFTAVQELMRSEGLLVGGSSGSALCGALKFLQSKAGQEIAKTAGMNVVIMLPDG
jgi:cystathionine beta-synthase